MIENSKLKIKKLSPGITIIELVIAISILVLMSVIGLGFYGNYTSRDILKTTSFKLQTDLRLAQSKAISGEADESSSATNWSIMFVNMQGSNDKYIIFAGGPTTLLNIATSSATSTTVFLDSKIEFLDPPAGATSTISFSRGTGLLASGSNTSTTISLSADSSVWRRITVEGAAIIERISE